MVGAPGARIFGSFDSDPTEKPPKTAAAWFGSLHHMVREQLQKDGELCGSTILDATMAGASATGDAAGAEAPRRLVPSSLKTVWYRTSPDFLFNALNSIEALSRQAPQRIPELVRGLSKYLRYAQQPQQDGWATLQQELDAVASYLDVEKVRFEDQFQVEFEIAEAARFQRVPQFFLQSLLENVMRERRGAGPVPLRVVVSCRCLDRWLQVEVRNTRVWYGTAAARDSGLEDLHRHLDLLYQEDGYGWTQSEGADWVSLTIEIPLETSGNSGIGGVVAGGFR